MVIRSAVRKERGPQKILWGVSIWLGGGGGEKGLGKFMTVGLGRVWEGGGDVRGYVQQSMTPYRVQKGQMPCSGSRKERIPSTSRKSVLFSLFLTTQLDREWKFQIQESIILFGFWKFLIPIAQRNHSSTPSDDDYT